MLRYAILMLFATFLSAQDRSSWQALSQLQPGEKVKLSLKGHGSVSGPFQASSPEQVTVGATTAKREDVAKLERFRKGGWSRGKTALVGAAIGGGVGAAIGAASGGCSDHGIGPCFTRAETGAAVGVQSVKATGHRLVNSRAVNFQKVKQPVEAGSVSRQPRPTDFFQVVFVFVTDHINSLVFRHGTGGLIYS